jgi:hypothetical protein
MFYLAIIRGFQLYHHEASKSSQLYKTICRIVKILDRKWEQTFPKFNLQVESIQSKGGEYVPIP